MNTAMCRGSSRLVGKSVLRVLISSQSEHRGRRAIFIDNAEVAKLQSKPYLPVVIIW